jgi:hypothetical protein
LLYALSYLTAILTAAASINGLLFRATAYPTDDLVQTFVPTDVVNLFIGLPILLGALALARGGRLVGLLLWPGALFFILYNHVNYIFAMSLNVAFLLHLALVSLSVYTLIGLVAIIDGAAVRQRLGGAVPETSAGGILTVLGLSFFLRALGVMASALAGQTPMAATDLGLQVSDVITAPAWVIGGVLLWRRSELGYVAGLGLLFQASMLFVGLIVFLLVRPQISAEPLVLLDVVVIGVMGLICFIPFARFARGVASSHNGSPT